MTKVQSEVLHNIISISSSIADCHNIYCNYCQNVQYLELIAKTITFCRKLRVSV